MPAEIYELIAQGARYWFLFLMVLIVWRSFRWYRRDRRQARKRLKLLPDAGFVGEMVVVSGGKGLKPGTALLVPREGTLGSLRTNDLSIPLPGVAKRHLWFRFEDGEGLLVEPFGKLTIEVDGVPFESRREPLYMAHGSYLVVGECELRLRLFAGFEAIGHAARQSGVEDIPEQPEQPQPDAAQYAAYQHWLMQQQYAAYQQGYEQAMAQLEQEPEIEAEPEQEELSYQEARAQGLVDDSAFMRPKDEAPVFYPPVMDEEEEDEALPKSAYVGHDESERAKQVWDKMFGGERR